jgi:FtsH-binding integral membrane protein
MAPKKDHTTSLRAVRQLHRMRTFYAAAALLWAASAAWIGYEHPGSRQMWVSALFMLVFTGLLAATSLWLRRLQNAGANTPAHHAAPRRTPVRSHVNV